MTAPISLPMRPVQRRAPVRSRWFGVLGLLAFVPPVLILTLWPTQLVMRVKPAGLRLLDELHERQILEWLTWTRLEVLANFALLIPFAALVTLALGARFWWFAALLGAGLSVTVEYLQASMPFRVASATDVIANSSGALVGAIIGSLIALVWNRSRRRYVYARAS